MKRARKSPDWKRFAHKVQAEGYEIIPRIGSPVLIHKKQTPFSPETMWWVFFGKKGGKWSKSQRLGMEILSKLGQKTFKYTPGD